MINYSKIFIGATFFAVSAASVCSDSLVIDEGINLGSDFVQSINVCKIALSCYKDRRTQVFADELRKRNIMKSDGRVSVFYCGGMLADYALKSDVKLLLDTTVTEIHRTNDGFELDIFNADGFSKLYAREIVDTRSKPPYKRKCLCAVLDGELCENNTEEYAITLSAAPNEAYFKVYTDEGYTKARARLLKVFERELRGSCSIASIAPCFAYEYDGPTAKTDENGVRLIPSASYSDMLAAFDAGLMTEAQL